MALQTIGKVCLTNQGGFVCANYVISGTTLNNHLALEGISVSV